MTEPGRFHRITLLIALYLAQGLPYGFFTQALPIMLRQANYSLKMISALSLLYLPWAFKFLWAPWLDQTRTRRAWLLTFQIASIVAALLLTGIDVDRHFGILLAAAFVFTVIAASQDVVTDGLAVRMLSARQLGYGNAIQVGAYRVGMILGAGALAFIYARTNWSVMFFCMAGLLTLTVLPVFSLDESPRAAPVEIRSRELLLGWARRLIQPGMLVFIYLVFCFRFGDAMVSTLLGPFMSDQGLSLETLALMKGTVGSATSLLGAVIGGWLVFRMNRREALLGTGLAQAASFVLYIIAASHTGGVQLLWAATILEGVVGTTATVALFTLMMDASDPEHAGTDYTVLASAYVLVSSIGSFAGASIADAFGYVTAFSTGTVLAAVGILLLVHRLDRHPTSPRVAAAWTAR